MARTPITFVAPIIRATLATLADGMPAQIAAFNAQPANAVQLTEPQTYVFGAVALMIAEPFPIIECAAVSGDIGNFTVARATGDHDLRLNCAVWTQSTSGDVPLLYEETLGLMRCVIEVLTPTGAFGAGVEIAQDVGISWRSDVVPADLTAQKPADGRPLEGWLGSGLIQFRVEAPPEVFA